MPMVPELVIAMLGCARIGAVHSVIFAGFSAQSLAERINDAGARVLITADGGYRGDKTIPIKAIADEAMASCEGVERAIVLRRTGESVPMKAGRDVWWHELKKKASLSHEAVEVDAEDPLFILYTSGSTGKPKGLVHTTAGYMVYTAHTFRNVFQYGDGDVYFCSADIGWVTGHSYLVYGPLLNGATNVMFEGVPTWLSHTRLRGKASMRSPFVTTSVRAAKPVFGSQWLRRWKRSLVPLRARTKCW